MTVYRLYYKLIKQFSHILYNAQHKNKYFKFDLNFLIGDWNNIISRNINIYDRVIFIILNSVYE